MENSVGEICNIVQVKTNLLDNLPEQSNGVTNFGHFTLRIFALFQHSHMSKKLSTEAIQWFESLIEFDKPSTWFQLQKPIKMSSTKWFLRGSIRELHWILMPYLVQLSPSLSDAKISDRSIFCVDIGYCISWF